jgi:hypothetical protein
VPEALCRSPFPRHELCSRERAGALRQGRWLALQSCQLDAVTGHERRRSRRRLQPRQQLTQLGTCGIDDVLVWIRWGDRCRRRRARAEVAPAQRARAEEAEGPGESQRTAPRHGA